MTTVQIILFDNTLMNGLLVFMGLALLFRIAAYIKNFLPFV
jgi:hypothetical protein